MATNPSGLTPTDFRPVTKTTADAIIAQINRALTPPASASARLGAPLTIPAAGTPIVLSLEITPRRAGSKLHVSASVSGAAAAATVVSAQIVRPGYMVAFNASSQSVANSGDVCLANVAEMDTDGVGVPITLDLVVGTTLADLAITPGNHYGASMLVQEVGGT